MHRRDDPPTATLPQLRHPHGDQLFTASDPKFLLFESFHPFSFAKAGTFPLGILLHYFSLAEIAPSFFAMATTTPGSAENLSPRSPAGPITTAQQ